MRFAIRHPLINLLAAGIRYSQCCSCKPFACFIYFVDSVGRFDIFHRHRLDGICISHCKLHRIGRHISFRCFYLCQCICLAYNQAFDLMRFTVRYPFIDFFTAGICHTQCCSCKSISRLINFVDPVGCPNIFHRHRLGFSCIFYCEFHWIGCCITIRYFNFGQGVCLTNCKP